MALGKLQVEKLEDCRHFNCPKPISNPLPLPLPLAEPQPPPISSTIAPTRSLVPSSPAAPRPRYRRLSPEEIADRHEKGLCYNCDEKFGPNHHCKAGFFLLIAEDEANQELPHPQISLNALSDHPIYEALRLQDSINHHPITILINGGSTHNFLLTKAAKFLGLPS